MSFALGAGLESFSAYMEDVEAEAEVKISDDDDASSATEITPVDVEETEKLEEDTEKVSMQLQYMSLILNDISETVHLQNTVKQYGCSESLYQFINNNNSFINRSKWAGITVASTESFVEGNRSQKMELLAATENIITKMWEAIVKLAQKIWNSIKNFWNSFFNKTKSQTEKIGKKILPSLTSVSGITQIDFKNNDYKDVKVLRYGKFTELYAVYLDLARNSNANNLVSYIKEIEDSLNSPEKLAKFDTQSRLSPETIRKRYIFTSEDMVPISGQRQYHDFNNIKHIFNDLYDLSKKGDDAWENILKRIQNVTKKISDFSGLSPEVLAARKMQAETLKEQLKIIQSIINDVITQFTKFLDVCIRIGNIWIDAAGDRKYYENENVDRNKKASKKDSTDKDANKNYYDENESRERIRAKRKSNVEKYKRQKETDPVEESGYKDNYETARMQKRFN